MYTLKFLIPSIQKEPHLKISTRQSNALRSGDLVFIFTLNHSYYRHDLFRRPFHYHHVWWTTKRRCKKSYFDNVERTKTTNNFVLDSWSIDFNQYLAICPRISQFWHCQSQKTRNDRIMCVSKMTFFATFDEKDDFTNCDFWRANLLQPNFSWAGISQNIHQNYVVSADMFMLPIFYNIVRLFRSTSHSSFSKIFYRRHKKDLTNVF